jgi:hypothetical protein
MRKPLARVAVSLVVAAGVALQAAPASAQWDFGYTSKGTPRGELSGMGYVFLILGGLGFSVPMAFAGAQALQNKAEISPKAGIGITVGGATAAGIGMLLLVKYGEPDAVAFAGTLVEGLTWSMTGVGIGAAASRNPRAPWLGGSAALGAFAITRMGLAFGGIDDFRGASWAQLVLGLLGGGGCLSDAVAISGRERIFASTCAAVSFAAGLAAIPMMWRNEPPPPPEKRARLVPTPWMTRDAGGLALAGVF